VIPPLVSSWTIDCLDGARFDVFVCSLGFETRARYIAEKHTPEANVRVALAFEDRQELAYAVNAEFLRNAGFQIYSWPDDDFADALAAVFESSRNSMSRSLHVCIDISSMSRSRVAACVVALQRIAFGIDTVDVDFVYTVAAYSPPPEDDVPPVHTGPVCEEFAGWVDPEKPTSLVLGLGYEVDRALGAFDLLEPADVWTFIPQGVSHEYDTALEGANSGLLKLVRDDAHKIYYSVERPVETFIKLESFVHGISAVARPVIVPFGPKIFALVSLLVACANPSAAIWRISFGHHERAVDRFPNGMVTGIRASFARAPRRA